MDDETRHEIEAVKGRIADLASCVRTLQLLAQQHHDAILAIKDWIEED